MASTGTARPMGLDFPLGRDPASVRRRIEVLEKVLERAFVIPGTRQPVGLDALAGLVPVVGDLIAAALGLYLVWEARNLGMPKWKIAHMTARIGFDTALGAVPLVGDLFDFVYRSNSRNLKTIRKHLDRHHPQTAVIDG